MIESFDQSSVFWILGTVLIALALTIFGAVTSSKLPTKQRKIRTRKFALSGLSVVFFCLPIFKPFVSSHSSIEYLDELKTENLSSVEEIARFEKDQTRTIERLKKELVELKADIYRVNSYYSSLVSFLSMMFAVAALNFALRKEENERDEN